ncbi:hypothetical protein ACOJVU_18185, partial [Mycobacterium sp. THU-M104]
AGVVVLLTGLYVAYYGYYEIRLYYTDADAGDPMVRAVGTVQSRLADWVNGLSPWLLLAVGMTLIAAGAGSHAVSRWRARSHDPGNAAATVSRPVSPPQG